MSKRTRPHLGGLWQWSTAGKLARLTCLSAVLTTTPAVRAEEPAKPVQFDPVAQQIEGWTVLVEPALLSGGQHAEEGERALKMLANHLQRISILVPEDRLEKLKQVEFWVEHAHAELRGKQYHPEKKWLTDRGYDPRLAKKIHITHAAELFSRQQLLKHPAVILHELAHAYHDQVLGFDEPRIIAAYDQAMKDGSYESVQLYDGRQVRHYAATNHKEYFAEATEAYFYRNDFYPFVRVELKRHDPTIHDLLVEIWGPANK